MPLYLAAALTAGALTWSALLVAAPLAAADGRGSLAPVAAGVYHASGRICHQRPERSFALGGVPLPVCARCSGLYVSGAVGALLAWSALGGFRRPSRGRMLLLAAAVPTAVTFTLEFVGLVSFSNATRFVAALPLGLSAGWLVVGMLRVEAGTLADRGVLSER